MECVMTRVDFEYFANLCVQYNISEDVRNSLITYFKEKNKRFDEDKWNHRIMQLSQN